MSGYYGPGIYKTECGYYLRESEKMITCEGFEDNTLCSTRFNSEKDKFEFQKKHCYKGVERCRHAKMLDEQYGN